MRAYLDHAATTPMLPDAAEAMVPWLTERFGNPSGAHAAARGARAAVDGAREVLAGVLGCAAGSVVWTGGGTEADNLAVRGAAAARPGTVVVSAVEHHAVLHAARATRAGGCAVREVGVTSDGVLDLDALADALDPGVTVVSVMLVNNEVGAVQPLAEVVDLVRRLAPDALVHTDAVQALRWLDLREAAAGADLVSISGHKFGGPQGVGALAARPGATLRRLTEGGAQERDLRPGTHNVAGIVATAAAAAATDAARPAFTAAVAARRDRLSAAILDRLDGVHLLAAAAPRTPGIATLCIDGVESEALLILLDEAGIAASAGSACASGAIEASHVLLAMGVPEERALGSLRLSLSPATTDDEVDAAADAVVAAARTLRARSAGGVATVAG